MTIESAVELKVDGKSVSVPAGSSILDACDTAGVDTPTICYGDTLTPVNACRACVVEVDGSGPLVPSCSREVEPDMVVTTVTPRVTKNRKLVLELLASSVDLSWANDELVRWLNSYEVDRERFAALEPKTVTQEPKIHDSLYVRDYSKCVLCYKCVEACGPDAQNSFAISVAGRGFDAEISTEFDTRLDESACVYCGNCIAVCPTGALTPLSEFELRRAGEWRPEEQTVTQTICSYCGVGCNLELHVQDNEVVKVTSPHDHDVTLGNLCVKGRFGWRYLTAGLPPNESDSGTD